MYLFFDIWTRSDVTRTFGAEFMCNLLDLTFELEAYFKESDNPKVKTIASQISKH